MKDLPSLENIMKLLPNPPHKGLPTPRGWGQTWDSLNEGDILPLLGTEFVAGLPAAAVGTGVGITFFILPWSLLVALGIMGLGVTGGLAGYGAVKKGLSTEE